MEYRKLKEEERSELRSRHKNERDKRVCDRIKAVLMYDDGILQKLEELHSQFSNFWAKLSDKILAKPSFYHSLRYKI